MIDGEADALQFWYRTHKMGLSVIEHANNNDEHGDEYREVEDMYVYSSIDLNDYNCGINDDCTNTVDDLSDAWNTLVVASSVSALLCITSWLLAAPLQAASPSSSVLDAPVSSPPTMEECIAVFQRQALSQPGTAANLVGWAHQIAQLAIKANLLDSTQHGQVLLEAYAEHTKLNMQSDFHQVDDGLMDQSTNGKE